jgi:hypothetical protein
MQATSLASRTSTEGQLRPLDVLVPPFLKHISNHSGATIILDVLPDHIFHDPLSYTTIFLMIFSLLKIIHVDQFLQKK